MQGTRQSELTPPHTRILTVGSLVAVLTSLAVSALAYGLVPPTVQIQLPPGARTGLATVPAGFILGACPALVTAVALGGNWLASQLRAVGEFEEIRHLHAASVLGTLAVLVGAQVVVIVANL